MVANRTALMCDESSSLDQSTTQTLRQFGDGECSAEGKTKMVTTSSLDEDTHVASVLPCLAKRGMERDDRSHGRSRAMWFPLIIGVTVLIAQYSLLASAWAMFGIWTTMGIGILSCFASLWVCLRVAFRQRHPALATRQDPRQPTDPSEYVVHGLGPGPSNGHPRDFYLDLLKRTVANIIYEDPPLFFYDHTRKPSLPHEFSLARRVMGEDGPSSAHTMIGIRRLDNLQDLIEDVLQRNVPGDLIETGVYRGGAAVFMRGVLKAHGILDRRVLACDTFRPVTPPRPHWLAIPILQALASIPNKRWRRRLFHWLEHRPNPSRAFPMNDNPSDSMISFLLWFLQNPHAMPNNVGTGLGQVKSHFARYGLLDEQVVFLEGFFADTLPSAPTDCLALMRLDGDTYESTMDSLKYLYMKLSVGGYCIVDDYCAFSDCERAVNDFRVRWQIDDEITPIDNLAIYWKKSSACQRAPCNQDG